MKALTWQGIGQVAYEDVPDPVLQNPDDAIVRVERSAVCGSDLHAYRGRIRGLVPGTILGHEYVGQVVDVGSAVTEFRPGDPVFGSFSTACGRCWPCRRGWYSQCVEAAIFGFGPDFGDVAGTQAERVRIPHADVTLKALPQSVSPEAALFVGDTLSTAYFAVKRAQVHPGDTVAVVGSGPVGILVQQCARIWGAAQVVALDLDPARLAMAEKFGAIPILADRNAPRQVRALTANRGADAVLEAVGSEAALALAFQLVRGFGVVSAAGVFTERELPIAAGRGFAKDLTLRLGVANVIAEFDSVLALVAHGLLDPTPLISHRMPLKAGPEAYRLFSERQALKIVLETGEERA